MPPETSPDDRVLAYVAGELSPDARRAFEGEMARDPSLRAEVEGMLALQAMLDDDMHEGLHTGDDEPPPHLVDAIMRAEALLRPAEIRAAASGLSISARDDHAPKSSLVSRLSSWIFGGGAAVLVAGAFVFLVVTKDDAPSSSALFEPTLEVASDVPASERPTLAAPKGAGPDDAVLGGTGSNKPAAPAEQASPRPDAERYQGSPGGGDERQNMARDGADVAKKPTEAPAKRSRTGFDAPVSPEPISGAKLDALGSKTATSTGGEYVVDSPGALVGKAKPRREVAADEDAAQPAAEPALQAQRADQNQSADKKAFDVAMRDSDGAGGFAVENSKESAFSQAERRAAKSAESEADDASPREASPSDVAPPSTTSVAKDAKPSPRGSSAPGRASAFGGAAPAPQASKGPPPLSPEEGALLRSVRGAELEKEQKKKSESKTAKSVEQAAAARREMDIEMMFATANSEFARGQLESALSTYVEAAALDEKGKVLGVLPHVGRMRTLNRLGRFNEALALVPKLKSVPSRPEDLAEGYLQAGDAAYALGRYSEAKGHYTLAKKSPTARARAETGLAAVSEQMHAPAVDAPAAAESK